LENQKGRDYSEDLGIDGNIMLEWLVGIFRVDASGSGEVPVAGLCEHGNEPSDSVKGMEFLDLSDY
jgi:hypothetical protein